jgi:hypothetical protein
LEISVVSARLLLKSVHLKKNSIPSPEAEIRRGPEGDLEIQSLIPKQGDEKTPVKGEWEKTLFVLGPLNPDPLPPVFCYFPPLT